MEAHGWQLRVGWTRSASRRSGIPFERSFIDGLYPTSHAEELGREFPGILGPMTFRPETASPLNELVNVLLRGESTLSRGEREMIATHVSWRNDCFFCQTIHGAVAAAQLGHDEAPVQKVKTDWEDAKISPRLRLPRCIVEPSVPATGQPKPVEIA
jgi:AhpD family alkylhydroperoxidase